ncbi:hypothetical protein Dsin_024451 [Dipteronia sinensis]|uniref:Reverse transcriptase zinc-binding domain-containing protein n=1 Tax=Dipteronia sinensis TaxID=43782 RepID=A0AAE0DW99_9ROSI|nr:hypothetical protein Dsin_024451 [Dipteronia sinensis]
MFGVHCTKEVFPDTIGWAHCTKGVFSVKSFWRCLEGGYPGEPSDHKAIWQGFCPPKIEVFVWQLLHGRILVRQALYNFTLLLRTNLDYPFCQDNVETLDHVFLNFMWSWKIWHRCMKWWDVSSYFSGRFGKRGIASFSRMARPILIKQWTWCSFRVAWCFKLYDVGSTDPITYMLLNFKDYCTDATKFKSPGIGGVLRDNRGKILCIFKANVGIQDAIIAEFLAIAKACALCAPNSTLDGNIICFVTDSKVAISWINYGGIGSVKHILIIYDIPGYLNSLTQAQVAFGPRAFNFLADSLEKVVWW